LGLLNLGFGQATVKYMAEHFARNEPHEAVRYLRSTLLFNLGVGLVGALLIFALAPWLSRGVFKIEAAQHVTAATALRWIALGWLVSQISATFCAVPTALQRYNIVSTRTMVFSTLTQVIGLGVLWAGGGFVALVQARIAWSIVTATAWAWTARRLVAEVRLWPRYDRAAFRRSFGFGVWQTVASVGGLLANQTDKLLLGMYLSPSAVGLFAIPALIFETGYAVVSKLGEVLFPAISELQGKGNEARTIEVTLRSSWLLCVAMVAIQGSFFVFAADILRLYVGPEVATSSSQVLRIFAFTAILSSPAIGVAQFLLGTGNTMWTAVIAITSGLVTLGASLILVPRFGLAGAAWSDLLAILLSRPVIHFLIWRRFLAHKVSCGVFFVFMYGASLAGMAGAGGLAFLRASLAWEPGWIGLVSGMGASFLLLGASTLLLDLFFPGNRERRGDLLLISRHCVTKLQLLRGHAALRSTVGS
jgi:O-antigen/teichoic acid export membrane protein